VRLLLLFADAELINVFIKVSEGEEPVLRGIHARAGGIAVAIMRKVPRGNRKRRARAVNEELPQRFSDGSYSSAMLQRARNRRRQGGERCAVEFGMGVMNRTETPHPTLSPSEGERVIQFLGGLFAINMALRTELARRSGGGGVRMVQPLRRWPRVEKFS